MDFTIKPLLPGMDFAGEVIGIDVASPINSSVYDQLRNALGKYAVLVFRNQNINDDQQIAFSEKFGSLEKSLGFDRGGGVTCLLYTSPSPRDKRQSRMPSSA